MINKQFKMIHPRNMLTKPLTDTALNKRPTIVAIEKITKKKSSNVEIEDRTKKSSPIIKIEDLTMAYRETPVLWDIDLEIGMGTRTAIVGPNGAGKSTLLKGILNLLTPLAGSITIWDKRFQDVRHKIAYVPQTGAVNWDFPTTVLDVVMMGRYSSLGLFKRPRKKERALAMSALEEMQMEAYADRQISRLSGGQKQRVFIARAICQDAELYLMDEPLAGVDEKTERVIIDKLFQFQREGKTVVAVHHDLNTISEYFDHVVLLNRTVRAAGPCEEVLTRENIEKAYSWDIESSSRLKRDHIHAAGA